MNVKKPRRSKKQELVKYLPEPERPNKNSISSITINQMSQEQINVIKGLRPGDRLLMEVKCVKEENANEDELAFFLYKEENQGLTFTEKYFQVSNINLAK